jgi:hypothetical protein
MAKRLCFATAAALVLGVLAVLGSGSPTRAQTSQMGITQTQTTPSYHIELDIGPAAVMLTPDQVASATSGEVMVDMSSMNMSSMSMPTGSSSSSMTMASAGGSPSTTTSMMSMATTDAGQPVNHHLEVHVYDASTGSVVSDIVPTITITDVAASTARTLDDVMAMYDIQTGMSDLHFGNNVYLPDGTYMIQVTVGQEMTQFSNVAVAGGMGLPADSMGMGSMSPS